MNVIIRIRKVSIANTSAPKTLSEQIENKYISSGDYLKNEHFRRILIRGMIIFFLIIIPAIFVPMIFIVSDATVALSLLIFN